MKKLTLQQQMLTSPYQYKIISCGHIALIKEGKEKVHLNHLFHKYDNNEKGW